MSKLSFRARALDATKPMPIYRKTEVSDLPDYSVLNRAVPQMPTGMDKEEESEHHLQRAISAQQVYGDKKVMVIPVPEAELGVEYYNSIYRKNFKLPKQFIHNQAQALNSILEQEKPDYDLDSDDEKWISTTNKRTGMDITHLQFEEMLDRLEKSCGSQVSSLSLQEAKLLLKEDDDLIKAVYEYWIKKRNKMSTSLIFQVRQERRDGSSSGDSYVAFRRRTEKMQTRKNRKNDEASYEKMLKLRRDLSRAVTILEMIKRREKAKRELLHLTLEIVEKRFQMKDFDGKLHKAARKETLRQLKSGGVLTNKHNIPTNNNHSKQLTGLVSKKRLKNELKRTKYSKHKIKISSGQINRIPHKRIAIKTHSENNSQVNKVPPNSAQSSVKSQKELSYQEVVDKMHQYEFQSSDEDKQQSPLITTSVPTVTSLKEEVEKRKNPDGRFAFKRKVGCKYLAPEEDLHGDQRWPWMCDDRHRYSLTTLTIPEKCIGFARRRMGRGGRMVLDRAYSPYTNRLKELDLNPEYQHLPHSNKLQQLMEEIKRGRWRRYRPYKPSTTSAPRHTPQNDTQTPHSNNASNVVSLSLPQLSEATNTVTSAENKLTSELLKAGFSNQRLTPDSTSSKQILLQNVPKSNAAGSHFSQLGGTSIQQQVQTLKLMSVVSSNTRTPSSIALLNTMISPVKTVSCTVASRITDNLVNSQARTIENGPVSTGLRQSVAMSTPGPASTTSQITFTHVPKLLVANQQDSVTMPTFTTKVSMATTGNTAMVTLTPTTNIDGSARVLHGNTNTSNVMAFVQQQSQNTTMKSHANVPALLRISAATGESQVINTTTINTIVPKTFVPSTAILTSGNKVHYTKTASGISLPLTAVNSTNLQQTLASKLTPQQQSQLVGQRSLSLSVNLSLPTSLQKQISGSTKVVLSSQPPNQTGPATTYNMIQSVGKQKVNVNRVSSNQVLTLQDTSDHSTGINVSSTSQSAMTVTGNQTNFVSSVPNVLKIGSTCAKVSLQPITSAPLKQLVKSDNTYIKTQPTSIGNTVTLLSSPQIRRNVKNISRTLNITSVKPQKTKQIVLPDTNILIPTNQSPASTKAPPTVVLSRKPPDTANQNRSNDARPNESKDNGINNNNDSMRTSPAKTNTQPMEVT